MRAICDIALHKKGRPVSLKEISKRQEISDKYLEQLLIKLRKAGLIRTVRGPGGGYLLTKSARKMKVGDVLRAVESLVPVYCIDAKAKKNCKREKECIIQPFWKEFGKMMVEFLDSTTLFDIVNREKKWGQKKIMG